MRVLETKPGKAVSIIECDMNVSMHVWEVVYHLSGGRYTICLGGSVMFCNLNYVISVSISILWFLDMYLFQFFY